MGDFNKKSFNIDLNEEDFEVNFSYIPPQTKILLEIQKE
jgi:hypothetical protein